MRNGKKVESVLIIYGNVRLLVHTTIYDKRPTETNQKNKCGENVFLTKLSYKFEYAFVRTSEGVHLNFKELYDTLLLILRIWINMVWKQCS